MQVDELGEATGETGRYSDLLRSGNRIPVAGEIFRTGPEAHPASCTMGTRSSGGKAAGAWR